MLGGILLLLRFLLLRCRSRGTVGINAANLLAFSHGVFNLHQNVNAKGVQGSSHEVADILQIVSSRES